MHSDYRVINARGSRSGEGLRRYIASIERATYACRADYEKPSRCTIRKDLPTDIGGADIAMQSTVVGGAPVAESSDDDDGGGGDADPDGRPSLAQSPISYVLRSAHRSCVAPDHARLLRLGQVKDRTGLSRSTIYQFIKDGKFPPSLGIGARAVAWLESDINCWIAERVHASIERAGAA